RSFGDSWFHYDVPRHLYHFDPKTLGKLLADAGFHVTETHTRNVQYDAFGAVQSFLNLVLPKPNLLNNVNTGQTTIHDLWSDQHRFATLSALAFSELVLALGFPVMAAFSVLSSPWTDGGTLRFIAQK